jgi:2'-5' RNA ligase
VRVFIAIELESSIKEKIGRIQTRLKVTQDKIKWVKPSSVHLTLKFLGEIEEEKLEKIHQITRELGERIPPFKIEFKGMGVFPGFSSPRVIWIGARDSSSQLEELATSLEEALAREGFVREKRKWKAHLTLGRIKFLKERERLRELIQEEIETEAGDMEVKDITIMRSQLTPQGPIYTSLGKIYLEGDK